MTEPTLTLRDLLERRTTAEVLRRRGLSGGVAGGKAAFFHRSASSLRDAGFPEEAAVRALFVPGRIEVLGKHTDYAGGRSLLAASEAGVCFVALELDEPEIRALALDVGESAAFPISPDLLPRAAGWPLYLETAARRLARNFPGAWRGAALAFTGDLPPASGMSSSSSLVVGFSLILSAINDLPSREEYSPLGDSREQLAGYLATIENGQSFGSLLGDRGVGTFGGSEDHTAILGCHAGRLSQYSFCPARREAEIPMPEGMTFVVAASGIAAEKTGAARDLYNRASRRADEAVQIWRERTGRDDPHLGSALRGEELRARLEAFRSILRTGPNEKAGMAQELIRRVEQFAAESEEIIPAAVKALQSDDLDAFGRLVDRSQALAESHLRNQVPETVFLPRAARGIGARASCAFGAGFGGSVWALVARERADEFRAEWLERYREAFPAAASGSTFLVTGAGPAAFEL